MGEEGSSGRARHRAKVLDPVAGGRGHLNFGEDAFDQAVEEGGLIRDVAVDGHRVDAEFGAEPAHGQPLEAVSVGDAQRGVQDLIS